MRGVRAHPQRGAGAAADGRRRPGLGAGTAHGRASSAIGASSCTSSASRKKCCRCCRSRTCSCCRRRRRASASRRSRRWRAKCRSSRRDVGGLPEVIEHGVSGFLHPLDGEDEMADSAVALLTDPERHRAVAQAACRRVREEFCVERVVPMYESFYRGRSSLQSSVFSLWSSVCTTGDGDRRPKSPTSHPEFPVAVQRLAAPTGSATVDRRFRRRLPGPDES